MKRTIVTLGLVVWLGVGIWVLNQETSKTHTPETAPQSPVVQELVPTPTQPVQEPAEHPVAALPAKQKSTFVIDTTEDISKTYKNYCNQVEVIEQELPHWIEQTAALHKRFAEGDQSRSTIEELVHATRQRNRMQIIKTFCATDKVMQKTAKLRD